MPASAHLAPAALLLALALAAPARGAGEEAAPPYPHAAVRVDRIGEGPDAYWLLEPAEPTPARAPVVVFLHGWLSINPGIYGAWLEHLARRGFVVVYPRYQDPATDARDFLPHARAAIADALDVLRSAPGHVRPDLARFALVGHSAGANLAAQLAAEPGGLPPARAVVAVLPGEVVPQEEPSPAAIPSDTLLVVAAADRDLVVGDARARAIYSRAAAVPPSRKEFVLYRTDRRGPSPITADHAAPTAAAGRLDSGEGPFRRAQMALAGVDALDRRGFWRLADVTLDAAFDGRDLDDASAGGAAFRDLGARPDGSPYLAPLAGDDLAAIPRVVPAGGARLFDLDPRPGP